MTNSQTQSQGYMTNYSYYLEIEQLHFYAYKLLDSFLLATYVIPEIKVKDILFLYIYGLSTYVRTWFFKQEFIFIIILSITFHQGL